MEDNLPDKSILFADSCRGIRIPQYFSAVIDRTCVSGIDAYQWRILEYGPHSDNYYWDVWDEVERDAVVTDENGQQYNLYHDGDLWLVPLERENVEKII